MQSSGSLPFWQGQTPGKVDGSYRLSFQKTLGTILHSPSGVHGPQVKKKHLKQDRDSWAWTIDQWLPEGRGEGENKIIKCKKYKAFEKKQTKSNLQVDKLVYGTVGKYRRIGETELRT